MFVDRENVSFVNLLESKWQEIRKEYESLPFSALTPWPEKQLNERGWEVFGLKGLGKRIAANCDLCPKTAEIIETIPGVTTAGFSRLAPGACITPHVGYTNTVLRCHLGLIVPPDCGIEVGGEIRTWEEGRCLIFDDTVLHSAWNNSSESRIILLLDFVRPDCTFDPTITPEAAALLKELTTQQEPRIKASE